MPTDTQKDLYYEAWKAFPDDFNPGSAPYGEFPSGFEVKVSDKSYNRILVWFDKVCTNVIIYDNDNVVEDHTMVEDVIGLIRKKMQ